MKSICVLAAVLVIVGAEKRSDFGVFGGQLESGFIPIVGHQDDQYIKSFGITKKVPLSYQNFEKKVNVDKPYQVYMSRPHTPCPDKKVPQPITVEKHILVPVKIPIMRPYPVYVEKKVPYQVDKKVPYFVYRNYPIHVEKPLMYHLKEENQFAYPVEKPSSLQVNNHVQQQIEATLAPSYQFKVPQEGLYAAEGHKAQAALREGYDGTEYFFGDYFGKGLQQSNDQTGKQQSTHELSTSNKQIYV
ncbi:uncharacterized protein [Halyomorpha halys]|uniref:uncharacterized protein n=1 Tax=Halyomorpha halys TaxID=286706 RepID=UPI0006D4FF7D|nr:uncharacterized protein LOC106686330 [Halyomorpha halys]